MDWYDSLDTPAWTPPGSWFGPVWTVLYAAMAVAAVIVLVKAGSAGSSRCSRSSSRVNLAWPVVFFGWHRLWLSAVLIVVLIPLIAWCTVLFWPVSPVAGALLVPYLAWVAYAATLNVAIARDGTEPRPGGERPAGPI